MIEAIKVYIMKKYFFGIFGIVLTIGLSAFTANSDNKASNSTELYWYDQGNNDLNIYATVEDRFAMIKKDYPSYDFNTDGSAGIAWEYGREIHSPTEPVIVTIYMVSP